MDELRPADDLTSVKGSEVELLQWPPVSKVVGFVAMEDSFDIKKLNYSDLNIGDFVSHSTTVD